MGTIGTSIIKTDVKKLVLLLNKAFADEWLAYYQYWIGAQVIQGNMKSAVVAELQQHAQDELRHAQMLTTRIMQLEGTPLLEPKDWYKFATCGYMAPKNFAQKKIVEQNIAGEQCAIKTYNQIVELTYNKDLVTYNLVSQILTDEIEHEDDLQKLLEDMKVK